MNNENKIFQNPDIDLVCICSYDNYHFSHVKESLKNNKHIFVEKPLCLTSNELNFIRKSNTKKYFFILKLCTERKFFLKKLKKKLRINISVNLFNRSKL